MDLGLGFDCLFIAIVATSTVFVGTWVMVMEQKEMERDAELASQRAHEHHEVTFYQALTFPLSASASLLALFFFFDYVQYVLLFFLLYAASLSLYQFLSLCYSFKLHHSFSASLSSIIPYLNGIITALVVIEWIRSGNAFCHNVLGCALCVTFISVLRFPSLRIATLCLSLLLIYDLFWVFFSEYFFSDNVMVAVATKQASNPVHEIAHKFDIQYLSWISPHIELPIKLIFPSIFGSRTMMLGLGDIALPGALVALARRCDELELRNANSSLSEDIEKARNDGPQGNLVETIPLLNLFQFSLFGYFVSLLIAFVANWWSSHPQPALIYLVPGIIVPIVLRAFSQDKLGDVWNGRFKFEFSK